MPVIKRSAIRKTTRRSARHTFGRPAKAGVRNKSLKTLIKKTLKGIAEPKRAFRNITIADGEANLLLVQPLIPNIGVGPNDLNERIGTFIMTQRLYVTALMEWNPPGQQPEIDNFPVRVIFLRTRGIVPVNMDDIFDDPTARWISTLNTKNCRIISDEILILGTTVFSNAGTKNVLSLTRKIKMNRRFEYLVGANQANEPDDQVYMLITALTVTGQVVMRAKVFTKLTYTDV